MVARESSYHELIPTGTGNHDRLTLFYYCSSKNFSRIFFFVIVQNTQMGARLGAQTTSSGPCILPVKPMTMKSVTSDDLWSTVKIQV